MVICITLALSVSGCGKTGLKIGEASSVVEGTEFDVSMEIVDGAVTPIKATLRVTNNTDLEIESGNAADFTIEVLQDDEWKTIEIGERNNTAEAIGFVGESELEISWINTYGKLPGGKYRIVKCFFPLTEDGSYGVDDRFFLTAEFNIE